MPKSIQIRDVDDEIYKEIARRAAEQGYTVPEWLRREIARLASRPTMKDWLERTRRKPPSKTSREEVIATLDTWRGPWPDADR